MTTDLYYYADSLLLHGNGSNGSTTFTDSGPSPKTMTATACTISTAQSKYGGASMVFDGSSSYLSTPDVAAFQLGAGEFTVEAWVRPTSVASAQKFAGIWSDTSGVGFSWKLGINGSGRLVFIYSTTGGDFFNITASSGSLSAGAWAHVAAARTGNTLNLFADGVLVGTGTLSATIFGTTGKTFEVGRDGAGPAEYFGGYMDDLRITKGIARYTAAFTPPAAELPDSQDTTDTYYGQRSLIAHFNGTNGATTATDSSLNAHTITFAGNAQLSTAQSLYGGASLLLDGTGDHVSIPDHPSLNFGSGDWMIDFGIRMPTLPGGANIIGKYGPSVNYGPLAIYGNGSSIRLFLSSNGTSWGLLNDFDWGVTFTTNTWYQLRVERTGNTIYCYVDGVMTNTTTIAGAALFTNSYAWWIGDSEAGASGFAGYIDEVRFTKGLAESSSSGYTPPGTQWGDSFAVAHGSIDKTLGGITLSARDGGRLVASLGSIDFAAIASQPAQIVAKLGQITMAGIGHDSSGENAIVGTLGAVTMDGRSGGKIIGALGSITAVALGTSWNLGRASAALGPITMIGSGTVTQLGQVNATLGPITVVAISGARMAATLGAIAAYATGKGGGLGRVDATLNAITMAATGTQQNHGAIVGTLGPIVAGPYGRLAGTLGAIVLEATGGPILVVSYEGWNLNMKHIGSLKPGEERKHELTHLTALPFDGLVRWQGEVYGYNANGVFKLGGTTDNPDASTANSVPWAFQTASTDFDTSQLKTIKLGVFHGQMPPTATVSLYTGAGATQSQAFTTPRAGPQNYSQDFGKGLAANYFAIGADAELGPLSLECMELDVANLSRRY